MADTLSQRRPMPLAVRTELDTRGFLASAAPQAFVDVRREGRGLPAWRPRNIHGGREMPPTTKPTRAHAHRSPSSAHRSLRLLSLALIALAVGGGIFLLRAAPAPVKAASGQLAALRVSGNQLVDANGSAVHLRGVNRSGSEYACIQGWGFFDGPSDAASVQAMASWGVTSVRVPLNEDCWLGLSDVPSGYGGAVYQTA